MYRSDVGIGQNIPFDATKQAISSFFLCGIGKSSAWCVTYPTNTNELMTWLVRGSTVEATEGTLYIIVEDI